MSIANFLNPEEGEHMCVKIPTNDNLAAKI